MHGTRPEFVEPPSSGRVFSTSRRVSIDDADPAGRMQLDAIARVLQDAGNDDTDDAGLPRLGLAWVARRLALRVEHEAVAREALTIDTWCSGTGRRWAERRTRVCGELGARIDAAALWVHVDTATGRPVPWGDEFADRYLEAAGGREIDARLRHPKAPDADADVASMPWRFRASDMDPFGHANNAAYLAVLEELGARGSDGGRIEVEVEWRLPAVAGEELEIRSVAGPGERRVWLADDDVRATFVVRALTD